MDLTKEQLNSVTEFAEAGMNVDEIAIILDVDRKEFIKQVTNINSDIYKAYQKGLLMVKYRIQKSIIKMAERGSNPAQIQAQKLIQDAELKFSVRD